MAKGPKDWAPRPDKLAEDFEREARQAFVDIYGPPEQLGYVERSIRSSYLPAGKDLGWTEPSETVVLVLTEFGWVQDPYRSKEDYAQWEKVAKLLRERGWPRAAWESINPGVQVVYWVR